MSQPEEVTEFEEGNRPHVAFLSQGKDIIEGDVTEEIIWRKRWPDLPNRVTITLEDGSRWNFASVANYRGALGQGKLFA